MAMILAQIAKRLEFNPPLWYRIFWIANHHVFDPLLPLVANVISKLETHEDMLSSWRVYVIVISVLGGLVVMMLTQIPRDWSSIPH